MLSVFTLSPLINEVISRIPFIRWCVLGIKRQRPERSSGKE